MQSAATVTRLIITAVPDGGRHAATTGTGLSTAPGAFNFGGDWTATPGPSGRRAIMNLGITKSGPIGCIMALDHFVNSRKSVNPRKMT